MRNLVKGITFEAGTRTIHIPLHEMTGIENIRLIVNETQKVVICSSMQKDNITSCVKDNVNGGWDVTYKNDIPALASGDVLTVEIDLGNHNYIDGTDWIVKIRNNTLTTPAVIGEELASQLLPRFLVEYGNAYLFYNCPMISSVQLGGLEQIDGGNAATSMFQKCTGLISVDLSGLRAVKGINYAQNMFSECSNLKSVDMSSITEFANGERGTMNMFSGCSSMEHINLSSLTRINGSYQSQRFLSGCRSLQSIELPLLQDISGWGYMVTDFFSGCISLTHIVIHPNACASNSHSTNIIVSATVLEDLELSADASTDLYLSWQPNLNFASVKNILEHCANANMSGKTITFYSGGLTVQDDADGTIQTLYNSVVNTYGATIANLTIIPYSA